MNTKTPLLSVVVPVYGTEEYLPRCIESMLEQSYKNLEIIIVNDSSPGECREIVEKYMAHDPRIKYTEHEKNKGLFRARVTGAELATGDYIAFVDSDDYLSLDFYRAMVRKAVDEDFEIVANTTVRENEDGHCSQFTFHKICFEKELRGENVRNVFFGQAGECYAWHTIWNKIYKKTLWDKCMPEYRKIDQHLIMTEDIAFSSLLFFHAESFASVKCGAYYYCFNENASTNSANITFKKFTKNVTDIALVFRFVCDHLTANHASEQVMEGFNRCRLRYACMWEHLRKDQFSSKQYEKDGIELIQSIAVVEEEAAGPNKFEQLNSSFNNELENIRRKIASDKVKVVSFDVFDTLILRPVWDPEDVFILMQKRFEKICPELRHIDFPTYRKYAERRSREELSRRGNGYEDVTLTEIYENLKVILSLNDKQCSALRQLEEETELSLVRVRKTGRMLMDFALACGKQVVLTSDMYLEKDTVEAMLKKCGYKDFTLFLSSEIRLVKFTGNLYQHVAAQLDAPVSSILHIGDNWNVDITLAQEKGFDTAFLPKTKDVFCNAYPGNKTNGLASIGNIVGNQLSIWGTSMSSLAHRSMMMLAANELFDDPFASWAVGSDFDANPCVVGYYALGMHMVSVCSWIADIAKKKNTKDICFLARDGYLPIRAFEKMAGYFGLEDLKLSYVPCSRRALLPWIIDNKHGLLDLPVNFYAHTPVSLVGVLKCCSRPMGEKELTALLRKSGFLPQQKFASEHAYSTFLTWYAEHLFSEELLETNKEIVSRYYRSVVAENAIVFDLGYSGRIPAALSKSLNYPVTYAYIHGDFKSTRNYIRRENIEIEVMYPFALPNTDLIRELMVSEQNNQCMGIIEDNGQAVPVLEQEQIEYIAKFTLRKFFDGALQFVDDYLDAFASHIAPSEIDALISSMPFEGFLSASRLVDRQVLCGVNSDDTVYGNNAQISTADFWSGLPDLSACMRKCDRAEPEVRYVHDTVEPEVRYIPAQIPQELADFYQDGLFMKLYRKINVWAPKGSRKRAFLKKVAGWFFR